MYLNQNCIENIAKEFSSSFGAPFEDAYNLLSDTLNTYTSTLTLPERCGPPLWDFLHWIALVADDEKKPQLYAQACNLLLQAHPCKTECRPHLQENLKTLPIPDTNCFEHSHRLHNLVNRQLSKENYPFEKLRERISLSCNSCTFSPLKNPELHVGQSKNKGSEKGNSSSRTSIVYPVKIRTRGANISRLYKYNRGSKTY